MKQYLNIILVFILFILEPEDSITGAPVHHELILRARGHVYTGTLKIISWIVIAIVTGLAIARL